MGDSEGSYLLEQAMFEDFCKQQDDPWEEDFIPISWTTNDGRVLLIFHMTDDHIRNCITWLKENRSDRAMCGRMIKAFEAELSRRPKPAKFHSLD